jgi:hypothetical protein
MLEDFLCFIADGILLVNVALIVRPPHPRSAIAFKLVSTLANDFCQAMLTILTMSLRSSVAGKPARILRRTVSALAFLLKRWNILYYTRLHLVSNIHKNMGNKNADVSQETSDSVVSYLTGIVKQFG